MKKVFVGTLLVALVFITSCSKNSNSSSSNSWSFKGNSYNTVTSAVLVGVFEAVSTNSTLSLVFYNNAPTTTTTYTVASGGSPGSNSEIGVTLSVGTNNPIYYSSTASSGTQQITVNVGSNGKLSASASGVVLSNNTNFSDTAAVNFNISQQ